MSNNRFGLRTRNGSIRSLIEGLIGIYAAPGLFDDFPAPAGSGGWSLNRRLSTSYSGALFRAVRVSDLAELDIIFNPTSGVVDSTQLAAFAGSDTVRVSRIYGQLGGNNLQQNTLLNMPRIVNSGSIVTRNGKLAAEASTTEFMNFGTQLQETGGEWGFWCIYEKAATTNNAMIIATGGEYHWLDFNASQVITNSHTVTISPVVSANTYVLWNTIVRTGVRADVWINNALRGSNTSIPSGLARSDQFPGSGFRNNQVTFSELIYYKNDQTTNRTEIATNINNFYGTY
jgi:hypothetical protein